MTNPFGIEHPVSKRDRDYSRAQAKYERKAQRANYAENIGGVVAGAAGAPIGAAALRDAVYRDKPGAALKSIDAVDKLPIPEKAKAALVLKRPGWKTMGVVAGATATSRVGTHRKKKAEKKRDKYAAMSKSYPLSDAVRLAKGLSPDHTSEASMRRHRKAQGVLGTTAATTGLLALSAKTAPKFMSGLKATGKGKQYQKHLDGAASGLLFAGAGIGGASGIHQSRIYAAEGKQTVKKDNALKEELMVLVPRREKKPPLTPEAKKLRRKERARGAVKLAQITPMGDNPRTLTAKAVERTVFKAYDPDKHRVKRQKATEVGLGAVAVGAGAGAVQGTQRRSAVRAERARVAETRKEGMAEVSRASRRLKQADAETSYVKGNNYGHAKTSKKPTADKGLAAARAKASQMAGVREVGSSYEKLKAVPKKLPRGHRGAWAAGAVAAAGGAAVTHRNRKREEKRQATPTRGWYSG